MIELKLTYCHTYTNEKKTPPLFHNTTTHFIPASINVYN